MSRVWQLDTGSWRGYGLALGVFAAVTLLNLWLFPWIGCDAVGLIYLLAVVFQGLFLRRGAVLLGTILTSWGLNYFFIPPRFSFDILSVYDKMMFPVYVVVGVTVGQLTARLRMQKLAEHEREARTNSLYLLVREMGDCASETDILEKAISRTREVFLGEVAVLLATQQRDELLPHRLSTWNPNEREQGIALSCFERNESGDLRIGGAHELFVPLSAGGAPTGIVALRWEPESNLTPAQRSLLENFVRQIALVLDRQRLREKESRTRLLAESERLGRTLLSSVSHELRTPLAAMSTAAHTLCATGPLSGTQEKLAVEIQTASARLNRVVESLLSAARLRSGQLYPKMDWCDVSDVVRVALRNARTWLAGRQISNHVAADLPLVRADFVLLEQVLNNLLLNAGMHTPAGTPVEISARVEVAGCGVPTAPHPIEQTTDAAVGTPRPAFAKDSAEKQLVIEVADRGNGVSAGELEKIFEIFRRSPKAKPGGLGLGLAIVKGFIEAQGGNVSAANRPDGGAVFRICLPAVENPKLVEERA
jgi:two-component system sensor histidine kinase KdpD